MQPHQYFLILNLNMKKIKKTQFVEDYSHQTSINSQRSKSKSPTHHKMSLKSPKIQTKRSPIHHKSLMIAKIDLLQHLKQRPAKVDISQKKLQSIQKALDIEKNTMKSYQDRISRNKLYLKYGGEPSSIGQKQKENNISKNGTKQTKKKQNHTLIQAVQFLRDRQDFSSFKNRINILEGQCQRILKGRKNKSIIQKERKIQIVEKPLQLQKTITNEKNVESKIMPSQLQLWQILNIEEQNFFAKKRNSQLFNIFLLVERPNDPMFFSGREHLQAEGFAYESIVHNNNNKKFNQDLYRNLSLYSRMLAVKNNSKTVPKNFRAEECDIVQAIQCIGINQIIGIANGQVTPEIIKNILEKQYVPRQIIQEELQRQITYQDNDRRKNVKSFVQTNQRDAEFKYYKQLKTTKQQQQKVEKEMKKNQLLEQLMTEFIDTVLQLNISDRKFTQIMQTRKAELLKKNFDDFTNDEQTSKNQNDKKVRRFKMNKDKSEAMKLQLIRQNLRKMKQIQKILGKEMHLKSISKQKSKSKTKEKTKKK